MNILEKLSGYGFTVSSPTKAIQEVREYVNSKGTPLTTALDLIVDLTGQQYDAPSEKSALHVAQHIVEHGIRQFDQYDGFQAFTDGVAHADKIRNNPAMSWLFQVSEQSQEVPTEVKVVGEVKVAVKSDGKIKKGGKQELAVELFKKHVVGEGLSNQEFIKILEKELDMSKAGATTYAYNARKQYQQSTGTTVDVKMSPKGRKAKK